MIASLLVLLFTLTVGVESRLKEQPFREQIATAPWSARAFAFTFNWTGGLWVAGGTSSQDLWSSYDFGKSWTQAASALPGPCWSTDSQGIVYADTVYLMCAFEHGANVSPMRPGQLSYKNKSPYLSKPWQTINDLNGEYGNDGLTDGRTGFSVNQMAVPFDHIGSLILINGELYDMNPTDVWGHTTVPVNSLLNDVWWLSATKSKKYIGTAFQKDTEINVWYPFQDPQATQPYTAPWSRRSRQSTVTDSEGYTLIMVGGYGYDETLNIVELNDVWQLTWRIDQLGVRNPYVWPLADAKWSPRFNTALFNYDDYFFMYGGEDSTQYYDDIWITANYGITWRREHTATTGTVRSGIDALVFNQRLFVVAGQNSDANELNDVWSSILH